MTDRTQEQAVANQIDLDLDNLVRRCLDQGGRAPKGRKHWEQIATQIACVRIQVRLRMHEADRKATQ